MFVAMRSLCTKQSRLSPPLSETFSPFVRKLHRWGFERIMDRKTHAVDVFRHPLFIRGNYHLCDKIRCIGRLVKGPLEEGTCQAPFWLLFYLVASRHVLTLLLFVSLQLFLHRRALTARLACLRTKKLRFEISLTAWSSWSNHQDRARPRTIQVWRKPF